MLLKLIRNSPKAYGYGFVVFSIALFIISDHLRSLPVTFLLSLSVLLFLMSTLFLITSNPLFSLLISATVIVLCQLMHYVKIHFYKDPLMFQDFKVVLDPENFETLMHYPSLGVCLLALIILFVGHLFVSLKYGEKKQGKKKAAVAVAILSVLTVYSLLTSAQIKKHWVGTLPRGSNVIANIMFSFAGGNYTPPSDFGVTSDYFLERGKNYFTHTPGNNTPKPDMVVLLQESTVNPAMYALPQKTRLPSFSMFSRTKEVAAHGLMRVHTFGGGTWLSEFALLTGLSSNDFDYQKMAVYYSVVPHLKTSLFKVLKENGYKTIILTPFNKSAYHGGDAYTSLGVDRIIQPQELGYPAPLYKNLWTISSKDMLGYVKQLLEAPHDEPLFIFALTMNEHGPYHSNYPDNYHLSRYVPNQAISGRLNHYLHKLTALDQAMEEFSTFITQRERKTLFLYFGDHQPNLGWTGRYNTPLQRPDYLTQFYLKDNLDLPFLETAPITDIAFVGGLLLERADLKLTPFYQANIALRNLCQGGLEDCQDKQLVKSYKNYIYHELKIAS